MSKTNLRDVQGWTPLLDSIIEKQGLTASAVFGVIWRHCQMDGGVCFASQETLSNIIGVSRQTFNGYIPGLVEDGYLEEVKRPGHSTVYKDTGKAGIKMIAFDGGVKEFDSGCKETLQQVSNNLTPGVKEFDTNKTLKTPSIDQEENKQDRFPEIQKMVEQSTGYPMTQSDIEAINEMVKMGVVQEDISGAIEYFRGKDIVARGAQQILKSVRYQVAKRIQAFKAPAPETPKPTGKIMIELADGQIVEANA